MEAIISRPKTDAKQSPARKQVNKPAKVDAVVCNHLAREALIALRAMCSLATFKNESTSFRTEGNLHLQTVDHLLGRLLAPEKYPRHELDPAEDDIQGHLQTITEELSDAADVLRNRGLQDLSAGTQYAMAAVVDKALEYSSLLVSAYAGLPGTLEDLRDLTTFAGVRTFRDRPTPPIRRVERTTDELKNTAAHEAGEVGTQLALRCTWDIDAVACEIARLAGRVTEYDPAHLESLLLCYGLRIQALNGQVIAYFDQDGTTAGEMHRHIFMRSRPFPGDEQ